MKVAFIIFQGMTLLDFAGVYDAVTRLNTMGFLPDLQWDICAHSEEVWDERSCSPGSQGLSVKPMQVNSSLSGYDIIIVPGGFGTQPLANDESFIAWLKTAESCLLKVSVCTGSLLLAAAGFLAGKRATTHPAMFDELRDRPQVEVVGQRIVDEGDVITARGVTASIDLGLYLCEKLAGRDAKEAIRQQMDYPYGAQ